MAYLLDTNVVSELRKRKPHGSVVAWVQKLPETSMFLSAVTLGEIQAGIERTRALDPAKADELESWLDDLAATSSVLPADGAVLRRWAQLTHGKTNHHLEDALIAATALVHDLTVATRNVADFAAFGVRLVNPFSPRGA
jgi:predicted nucleic acid-binding protein